MANKVIMPRQGQSVESCIITKWHKKEGDKVAVGDLLFTYETDKATFDEESKFEGVMLKILRAEEDDVPCLEDVCVIGEPGEKVDDVPKSEVKAETVAAEVQAAPVAAAEIPAPAPERKEGEIIRISPRARNLAKTLGIDPSLATASGAEGRIIERDINELAKNGVSALAAEKQDAAETIPAAAAAVPAAEYTDVKMSNVRKVIAKAMANSLSTTAQLTHTASFDATEIMEFRKKIKPKAEKGEINNITLNDMVMYVVSRVLLKHRDLNANLINGDTMRYFNSVNLGMAVDTPRGLLVPVLFGAEKKSLNEMAGELKMLAKQAQNGTINPDLIRGGSFTVSNLGSFGVESFTPVLNAPETGILGVNTITTRVKEVNGQIKTYPCMSLSLTYDHRALDGAPASKFLRDVCDALENFSVSLAAL